MPVSNKLKAFLDRNKAKYVSIRHSPATTAQEVAASAHVKGKDMAKTVIIKSDAENVMAVLPATHKVDFEKMHQLLEGKDIRLATEQEFKNLFPECEVGAMPPFGNLYGLKVICDASLTRDDEIAFNAGTHDEVIRMPYSDFAALANPEVASFARQV